MYCIAFLYVFIYLFALEIRCNAQEVEIPQGILRGGTRTNRDGGTYYAFKNIPFGKPPVGELRFKAPEPAEGWEGVRDATQELPQCVQRGGDGQEDCLYLNIYTPELPDDGNTLKTVMVYIYGGAFFMGDAREQILGAQYFLTEDVVVVTFNYRLGALGLISLDDPTLGITGNAGLKDQVLALQWVQDNIEYFGGDPNNVLLFGLSAGAISTHLHLLSPMSKGLFHKAISESGVSIGPLLMSGVTRNTAVLLADQLGIATEDSTEMLSLLQEVPLESIVNAEIVLSADNWLFFGIIVEITSNQPAFLEREPIDIIRSGDFQQVPFLHGFNDAEGSLIFAEVYDDGVSPLVPDLTRYIPLDLQIEPESEAEQDVIQRLKDFYYDGEESVRENITGDVNLYGDFAFNFPHYRTTVEQLKTALSPIYLYYFTVVTDINPSSEIEGAEHGMTILYLWYLGASLGEGSNADLISRNMVSMWTNFAKYGNPTPEGVWQPVQENEFNFLHIGTEGSFPEVNVLEKNMQFWSDIYEEYYPN